MFEMDGIAEIFCGAVEWLLAWMRSPDRLRVIIEMYEA